MKLRNKKTGEVVDVESLGHAESLKKKNGFQVTLSWPTKYKNLSQCKSYTSLAQINEDWEDYRPVKPHRRGGMTRFELLAMVEMVLRGHFGNGRERRQRLGEHYEQVQRIIDVIIEEEK